MLSLVTAAEQQYRVDTASRAREHAVLRSITERREAAAAEAARPRAPRRRDTWQRPAGVQRSTAACATA